MRKSRARARRGSQQRFPGSSPSMETGGSGARAAPAGGTATAAGGSLFEGACGSPLPQAEIDEEDRGSNLQVWTVRELSTAIRETLEDGFQRVRVRGEVSRVFKARSGHVYFDLREGNSVLSAVAWKGGLAGLERLPEEGAEVVAGGRLTAYDGKSQYQLQVDELRHAGIGSLLKAVEDLRIRLDAEGLFREERKKPIPYLPEVIGVVTSPSGSVLHDILHRLRDRFPRRVVVWPAAVQGSQCPADVREGIERFNDLPDDSPLPRPDVIIVARGGGSPEDLAGFNDEQVVRAVAASEIPIISAVGHETDTTLIDHAADLRAPTPTAAAERAVPVRAELERRISSLNSRAKSAWLRRWKQWRLEIDSRRTMLRPIDEFLSSRVQRLDGAGERLSPALLLHAERARHEMKATRGRLENGWRLVHRLHAERLGQLRARLVHPSSIRRELEHRLTAAEHSMRHAFERRLRDAGTRLRLSGIIADSMKARERRLGERLERAERSLRPALDRRVAFIDARLRQAGRVLESVGHGSTLKRGFALVRDDDGRIVTRADRLKPEESFELEFGDGRLAAVAGERRNGS